VGQGKTHGLNRFEIGENTRLHWGHSLAGAVSGRTWLAPGHPASDYSCPKCSFWFQLKSQKSRLGDSITDGAYAAMMNAIHHDEMPSIYFMQYEISGRDASPRRPRIGRAALPRSLAEQQLGPTNETTWTVRNLLLVPSFAFPPSAIIKRKPLSSTARRAGWVGCNFALNRIPAEARIAVVTTFASARRSGVAPDSDFRISAREFQDGDRRDACPTETVIISPEEVRAQFKRVKPLGEIKAKERGWTLDVLNAIRRLGKKEFSTADAYTFTHELEKLHPDNRHVRDKIRQQLQVLRDVGLRIHIERGVWRLPSLRRSAIFAVRESSN